MEIRQTTHKPQASAKHAKIHKTKESYLDALSLLSAPAIPQGLMDQTLHTVHLKMRNASLMRFSGWLSIWLASVVGSTYFITAVLHNLQTSGIYQYLELIWSDGQTVLGELGTQFAIVILDTLPIFSIACACSACALFLFSLRKSIFYFQKTHEQFI
jgi:hypothetical protein